MVIVAQRRALNCDFKGYKCESYHSPMLNLIYYIKKKFKKKQINLKNININKYFDDLMFYKQKKFIFLKKINWFIFYKDYEFLNNFEHYNIVTKIKQNYRYFNFSYSTQKNICFYSGRELKFVNLGKIKEIKKIKIDINENFLNSYYNTINNLYVFEEGYNVVFLKITPVYIYYYKSILKMCDFFLKESFLTKKYIFFNFLKTYKRLKKLKSLKKNLKKKQLKNDKKMKYLLIDF